MSVECPHKTSRWYLWYQ